MPEPPAYTACIAHLEATAAKPAKGQAKPTPAVLKSECEQQYKSLQQEVLGFLISSEWVLGEGASLGVNVSDKEVKKQFETIKNQQFPKPAQFEKFLATSGQTVSDLLLRVKLNLLSTKIQQQSPKAKARLRRRRSRSTTTKTSPASDRPKSATCEIILTKTEAAAQQRQEGNRIGQELRERRQERVDRPDQQGQGRPAPGVVKGQEEKALDEAVFSASRACSAVR